MESCTLQTADGCVLEAELETAATPHAVAVLCHPHPQYGGTMLSIVISALFAALPSAGITCLRFNFRGVERSTGAWGEGRDEPADVLAAIDEAASIAPGLPLVVVGWSFGADMALSVVDRRIAGWIGIAAPLRFAPSFGAATDPRPKHLLLAQHDEFRPPAEVEAVVADWANTSSEVVSGASHFFVGRTDQVVDASRTQIARMTGV